MAAKPLPRPPALPWPAAEELPREFLVHHVLAPSGHAATANRRTECSGPTERDLFDGVFDVSTRPHDPPRQIHNGRLRCEAALMAQSNAMENMTSPCTRELLLAPMVGAARRHEGRKQPR